MKLAPQQVQAFDLIMDWFKDPVRQHFVLSGYAGTGKTTLAQYIKEAVGGDVIFCAYTGKAARVLQEKNCEPCGTIHSLLYRYEGKEDGEIKFGTAKNSPIEYYDLVIVDEFSMVPDNIIEDLLRKAKKTLFLGDPFQLPPVKASDNGLKLDFVLTEIHRQALDSPILQAAHSIRLGDALPYNNNGDFKYAKYSPFDFSDYDQVICGRNATRKYLNKEARKDFGLSDKVICQNDKVICLMNNKEFGLVNGAIGYAKSPIIKNATQYTFDFEDDIMIYRGLNAWLPDIQYDNDNEYRYNKKIQRFDFAYAITCHKSQGSEFDNLLIFNEPVGKTTEEARRWIYTAITRAKKTCTMMDVE